MLLTKSTTFIIGPVATLLGYIMNGIFWVQSQIGIESIGLCIILFTIVIYMLLMPLTIKQQKFSKLQSKMNPELQAIQKKYKDKRFAAGCSRDIIAKGADNLGWTLEELMEKTILAMRSCEERVNKETAELTK